MAEDLPPDDQPSDAFRAVPDEEAMRDAGTPGLHNAVAVGAAFLTALTQKGGPDREVLEQLVTPESLPAWGDFTAIAQHLADCGMTSRANQAIGDGDVVYVKYVSDPGQSYQVTEETAIMVRAVGTLVWRSELSSWRVHAVGDYLRPEEVPHGVV